MCGLIVVALLAGATWNVHAVLPGDSLAPAGSAGPFDWENLVFQSQRDGNWEIYLAEGGGANPIRLTSDPDSDVQPRLNSGCTRIVFASDRSGNYEIYAMNLDGSMLARLTTSPGDDLEPAWSPDGTRIAFESMRDGQSEVYVMNADGSGQTRLTTQVGYDGQPAWSPDGARLVFTSARSGEYNIWIMNADGSAPELFDSAPDSHRPAWSPDGQIIAFDADEDQDGEQEIVRVWIGGEAERVVLETEPAYNSWVRGWSHDSRYLAYTLVVIDGNVWTEAYMYALETGSTNRIRLGDGIQDWHPSWGTLDADSPVSSVDPLPPQSPGPFTVTWSGADIGPSGLKDYDVQVRDLSGGAWTDWLVETTATSASYEGVGGQTYFFRSRARDNAGNVETWPDADDTHTRIESCPPNTTISPLPAHFAGSQLLRWSGVELCGSTLDTYDVQFRDLDGGAWTDLEVDTREVLARVAGLPGHRYGWRSRGVDTAYNAEPWPPGDGDTTATVYAWSVTGQATDNAGRPVAGPAVTTTPPADYAESSLDGAYGAYLLAPAPSFVASWSKTGYAALPATPLSGTLPAQIDVVLPPADDVVQNGGFESGSLDAWTASGAYPPVISSPSNTGAHAVRLGAVPAGFGPVVSIGAIADWNDDPQFAIDGEGRIHVVWNGGGEIWYTQRAKDGSWSAEENVSNTAGASESPRVAVDLSGTVHVAWSDDTTGNDEIYYRQRAAGGPWQQVENASNSPLVSWLKDMAVDARGVVHTLWVDPGFGGGYSSIYTRRDIDGAWSAPLVLASGASQDPQRLLAEENGIVHAIWSNTYNVNYARSGGNGSWAHYQRLSEPYGYGRDPELVIDAQGGAHAVWREDGAGSTTLVGYAGMASDGTWSTAEPVWSWSGGVYEPHVGVDSATGIVHAIWTANLNYDEGDLYHAWRASDGTWSAPEKLTNGSGQPIEASLRVDARGTAHAVWRYEEQYSSDLFYAQRPRGGSWSAPQELSNTASEDARHQLVLDGDGGVHVIWLGGDGGTHVNYTGPAPASADGESVLSQAVPVAADGRPQTLSFLYQLHGASEVAGTNLHVELNDGLATTTLLSTAAERQDWTHFWADLTPWAGETVTLTFRVHEGSGHPYAWAYLDEVSAGSTYPDVWVGHKDASAEPGSQVALEITYGNRGAAPAEGVRLSAALPPELTFLAASLPPSTTVPILTWELGALPAASGPYTLVITAAVAGGTPAPAPLTDTVAITTTSVELEIENNTATGVIAVKWQFYLPLIVK